MPIVSTVRSLYVTLPGALDDAGLPEQAAAMRSLPLSTTALDLLRAADCADVAAAMATDLALRHRTASRREAVRAAARRAMGDSAPPYGVWQCSAQAAAADAAAVAARCAADAARQLARLELDGDDAAGKAAIDAAASSEMAAIQAALTSAAVPGLEAAAR